MNSIVKEKVILKKSMVLLVWLCMGVTPSVQGQSINTTIDFINEKLKSTGWHEYGQKLEYVAMCSLTNTVYYKNHGTREIYHFPLKELRSTVEYDDKLVTFRC